jgi:recombinational DNA repair ATPase RecF
MKITKLIAENVKKLSVVEITPDGNLVQITGKNGQGKSSVLDAKPVRGRKSKEESALL